MKQTGPQTPLSTRPDCGFTTSTTLFGLSELRVWKGNPVYKQIISRALANGGSVAKTTISEVLNGKMLPSEVALEGILLGLGLTAGDPEYGEWFEARRILYASVLRQKIQAKSLSQATKTRVRRVRRMRSTVTREERAKGAHGPMAPPSPVGPLPMSRRAGGIKLSLQGRRAVLSRPVIMAGGVFVELGCSGSWSAVWRGSVAACLTTRSGPEPQLAYIATRSRYVHGDVVVKPKMEREDRRLARTATCRPADHPALARLHTSR